MIVELSNGMTITYDWSAISQKEWRVLIDKATDEETNDTIVGKLIGMTADELSDLSLIDYRKVANGLFPAFKEALDTNLSKN